MVDRSTCHVESDEKVNDLSNTGTYQAISAELL